MPNTAKENTNREGDSEDRVTDRGRYLDTNKETLPANAGVWTFGEGIPAQKENSGLMSRGTNLDAVHRNCGQS